MLIPLNHQGYTAVIDSFGAELKSFTDPEGTEYIWNASSQYWPRSSPILFPSIGNVRNNKTWFKEREYVMPKHGFARDMDFTILEQSHHHVVLAIQDNAFTHESYPFSFRLHLTYSLTGQKLDILYLVINQDKHDLLYHIGGHPGFNCPLTKEESFSDYVILFEQEEHLVSYAYDLEYSCFSVHKKNIHGTTGKVLPLDYPLFTQDALYFYHTNSRSVTLKNPSSNKGIRLDYPDFSSIAFWTPPKKKAPFICLEPWNGSAIFDDEDDQFIHKRDVQVLSPGESKEYRLAISILK